LPFHIYILTHQNKVINKTWAYTSYIQSMFKHFKTIIMALKVINDFKRCITHIINGNLKEKNKEGGGVLIELYPLLKFEGLPNNEIIDSFFGFVASLFLIFSFFSISDWSRFPSFLFETQSLLPLFSFYSKYFIDFYIFSFLFLCNYLSNLSQDLLVCSRIIFYKLNKTWNGKTMVVLPRFC